MKKKKIIVWSFLGLLIISGAAVLVNGNKETPVKIETAYIERGSISKQVSATGALEAIVTVDVGTQVSGIIEAIYVDFNSQVKKGELIAKLDTTNLSAAMEQSRAALDNAKADLIYQQANFDRMKPLYDKGLIAQAEFDQTTYNLNIAQANYKSAKASHRKNQINLDYASIYSPIDGIVINRAVEEGQTVAASFSTPTLFSIANDLTQMQVEADVDEADIGQVKEGQRVEFTVDAYPDFTFSGEVTQLRLEPVVTNNMVTYTIIITAPNPNYKLMPGMTAMVNIFVKEEKDVLLIPSKALRFNPDPGMLHAWMAQNQLSSGEMPPMGEMPPQADEIKVEQQVWVIRDSLLHPVKVVTGEDDDIHVHIISGLKEGDEVVLDMTSENADVESVSQPADNPFMPKPPSREKKSKN